MPFPASSFSVGAQNPLFLTPYNFVGQFYPWIFSTGILSSLRASLTAKEGKTRIPPSSWFRKGSLTSPAMRHAVAVGKRSNSSNPISAVEIGGCRWVWSMGLWNSSQVRPATALRNAVLRPGWRIVFKYSFRSKLDGCVWGKKGGYQVFYIPFKGADHFLKCFPFHPGRTKLCACLILPAGTNGWIWDSLQHFIGSCPSNAILFTCCCFASSKTLYWA